MYADLATILRTFRSDLAQIDAAQDARQQRQIIALLVETIQVRTEGTGVHKTATVAIQ